MENVFCTSETGNGKRWVSAHTVAEASEFLVVVTEGATERAEPFDTLEQAELYAAATGGQLYQRSVIETSHGAKPNYVAVRTKPAYPAFLVTTLGDAFCIQLEEFNTEEQARLYAAVANGEVYRYNPSTRDGLAWYYSDTELLLCGWHAGKLRIQSRSRLYKTEGKTHP